MSSYENTLVSLLLSVNMSHYISLTESRTPGGPQQDDVFLLKLAEETVLDLKT